MVHNGHYANHLINTARLISRWSKRLACQQTLITAGEATGALTEMELAGISFIGVSAALEAESCVCPYL